MLLDVFFFFFLYIEAKLCFFAHVVTYIQVLCCALKKNLASFPSSLSSSPPYPFSHPLRWAVFSGRVHMYSCWTKQIKHCYQFKKVLYVLLLCGALINMRVCHYFVCTHKMSKLIISDLVHTKHVSVSWCSQVKESFLNWWVYMNQNRKQENIMQQKRQRKTIYIKQCANFTLLHLRIFLS